MQANHMKYRTSKLLFAYWDELRAGRTAPRRLDIEPSRIASILPETLILDNTLTGSYRFRIAGTRICDKLAIELRGIDFLALWSARDQQRLKDHFTAMTLYGQVTTLPVCSRLSSGGINHSEIVLLPLTDQRGLINRFVGAWSFDQMPSWHGAAHLTDHAIFDPNQLDEDSPSVAAVHEQPSSPSDPQPKWRRLVTDQRRRFRVYDGGRE